MQTKKKKTTQNKVFFHEKMSKMIKKIILCMEKIVKRVNVSHKDTVGIIFLLLFHFLPHVRKFMIFGGNFWVFLKKGFDEILVYVCKMQQ